MTKREEVCLSKNCIVVGSFGLGLEISSQFVMSPRGVLAFYFYSHFSFGVPGDPGAGSMHCVGLTSFNLFLCFMN